MTRRNKNKNAKQLQALEKRVASMSLSRPRRKKKPANTPFADVGSTLGRAIGGMFGFANAGRGVGKYLGSGIGSIFGSGDYTLAGGKPGYNVLTNTGQIPQFSTTKATNIICHREYLGDIVGTTAFDVKAYPLNPGVSQTFPWLSSVAQGYQQYRFHGLIFEFRSMLTDNVTSGIPGTVVLATSYNADLTTYANKQQMENSEYATSVKPTVNMIHGVECASSQTPLTQLYVRSGRLPTGQEYKDTDLGNFQMATQNNPVTTIGELWVSYCVEFFKPVLMDFSGGNTDLLHICRTGMTNAPYAPFGNATIFERASVQYTVSENQITFPAKANVTYLLQMIWTGGTATAWAVPAASLTGVTQLSYFKAGVQQVFISPPTGTTTTDVTIQLAIRYSGPLQFSTAVYTLTTGTFPTSSFFELVVSETAH